MLNGHGDDIHIHKDIKFNFSSNSIYTGCPKLLKEYLKDNINSIENYPSPIAEELNVLASKFHNIKSDQLLSTNGSIEAFYLISQMFMGKTALIPIPTFSEYESACNSYNIKCNFIKREKLNSVIIKKDLVFICNPNNPDGSLFSYEAIENLLNNFPETTFIVDEAYIEFALSVKSTISLIDKYSNIIIIRSLTKVFAIPGLRLGYIVSNSNTINNLLKNKMVWSVNSLAICAGTFIFNNYNNIIFSKENINKQCKNLRENIDKLENFETLSSTTNYFLVRIKNGNAKELKQYLIEKNILVRNATNFRCLNGEYIRISLQDNEANCKLIKELKYWK